MGSILVKSQLAKYTSGSVFLRVFSYRSRKYVFISPFCGLTGKFEKSFRREKYLAFNFL